MKIGLGLCYYEDLDGIKRLFESLEKVNASPYRIFAIDGKYKQFSDSPSFLSDSQIHQYLEQFPRVVNYTDWPTYPTEIEKRNKYLELATDLDFLIVIDSDEYFDGDWPVFVSNLEKLKEKLETTKIHHQMRNLHFIEMVNYPYPETSSLRFSNRPRLFYKPTEVRYYGCHYTWKNIIINKPLILPQGLDSPAVDGIKIVHDNGLRSSQYEENMKQYQDHQRQIEQQDLTTNLKEMNSVICYCDDCVQALQTMK